MQRNSFKNQSKILNETDDFKNPTFSVQYSKDCFETFKVLELQGKPEFS